eukprot:INCI3593.2.p1 GENE.INCI3593.2~~INCI3593.2.p1  ORF type:complete len:521 (-),score=72.52 INCI3593.2:2023-3585(-)
MPSPKAAAATGTAISPTSARFASDLNAMHNHYKVRREQRRKSPAIEAYAKPKPRAPLPAGDGDADAGTEQPALPHIGRPVTQPQSTQGPRTTAHRSNIVQHTAMRNIFGNTLPESLTSLLSGESLPARRAVRPSLGLLTLHSLRKIEKNRKLRQRHDKAAARGRRADDFLGGSSRVGSGVPSNSPAVSAAAAAGASKKKVRDAVPPSLEQQWLRSQRTQRSHTIEELTREVEADRLKVTQMHSSRNLSDALASGVIRHSKFKEFYRDCCVFSTDGMSREELAFAIVLMGFPPKSAMTTAMRVVKVYGPTGFPKLSFQRFVTAFSRDTFFRHTFSVNAEPRHQRHRRRHPSNGQASANGDELDEDEESQGSWKLLDHRKYVPVSQRSFKRPSSVADEDEPIAIQFIVGHQNQDFLQDLSKLGQSGDRRSGSTWPKSPRRRQSSSRMTSLKSPRKAGAEFKPLVLTFDNFFRAWRRKRQWVLGFERAKQRSAMLNALQTNIGRRATLSSAMPQGGDGALATD